MANGKGQKGDGRCMMIEGRWLTTFAESFGS